MEPNTIKINEIEYVRKDSEKAFEGDIKIVVLDRGFVYVGHVSFNHDNQLITITNAKNIRIWGTTKGLGQLVHGPLKDTKLDVTGTVHFPEKALIHLIDVEQSKWKSI
jgi:hypothetical protein